MGLLQNRIKRIKETLRRHDLDMAASLLINTVASDDMFRYWSRCCHNNEHVPKILRYLKLIEFDSNIPTAVIDFMRGYLRIGVQFFLDYIDGPEDLLFILIHERNHHLLRKLFPQVLTSDYPGYLFNFGEDVYINAISRRHLPSMLPERFYHRPMELLLTGRHSKINWAYFKLDKYGTNKIKDAHAAMYKLNYGLMEVLREQRVMSVGGYGYQQWMALILEWHKQMQERSQNVPSPLRQLDSVGDGESSDLDDARDDETAESDTSDDHASDGQDDETSIDDGIDTEQPLDEDIEDEEDIGSEPSDRDDIDSEPTDTDSPLDKSDEPGSDREVSESEDDPSIPNDTGDDVLDDDIPMEEPNIQGESGGINDPSVDDENCDDGQPNNIDPSQTDSDNGSSENSQNNESDKEDKGIDSDIKNIIPLVQDDNAHQTAANNGIMEKVDGMIKQPIPNLKPNDPIVQLILSTCEITEFRNQVIIFEGEIMEHIEGLIKGILSDRATERSFDGYSVPVPLTITRRDVFALSSGETPVLWQRRVGVERPCIDLYVDVSGSMSRYYGYIPFIYDALKHVMGRVFQFSTRIVEVDPKDLYLLSTGGTSFDVVANHMIKEQVKYTIIFSDGMSYISNANMEVLEKQLEYLVYIKIVENDYRNWEKLATDIILLQKRR